VTPRQSASSAAVTPASDALPLEVALEQPPLAFVGPERRARARRPAAVARLDAGHTGLAIWGDTGGASAGGFRIRGGRASSTRVKPVCVRAAASGVRAELGSGVAPGSNETGVDPWIE
jgi:hypothetical protein